VAAFIVEIMLAPALLVLAGGRRSARLAAASA
jgi:hypothetical protein